MGRVSITIVSDIHYASAPEQARVGHELAQIKSPLGRRLLGFYRDRVWLKDSLFQNHLLDRFLEEAPARELVVANGDYSCNTGFVGVSDDASCLSAGLCLGKLRSRYGGGFHATWGDHELGKTSMGGNEGGLRLASWERAQRDLGLLPFWRLEVGRYVLLGMVSSVAAFPTYALESLPAERAQWEVLRQAHLEQIAQAFDQLRPQQKVILFCHDPTALPYLAREERIVRRLPQLESTVIGHLHSELILRQSRFFAGMPTLHFLGHTGRRISEALGQARHWKPFKVRLCPSLAGIELLKDGGYLSLELDLEAREAARWQRHRLSR